MQIVFRIRTGVERDHIVQELPVTEESVGKMKLSRRLCDDDECPMFERAGQSRSNVHGYLPPDLSVLRLKHSLRHDKRVLQPGWYVIEGITPHELRKSQSVVRDV
jgi:hypothetical protein